MQVAELSGYFFYLIYNLYINKCGVSIATESQMQHNLYDTNKKLQLSNRSYMTREWLFWIVPTECCFQFDDACDKVVELDAAVFVTKPHYSSIEGLVAEIVS